jgi:hypothetical protein
MRRLEELLRAIKNWSGIRRGQSGKIVERSEAEEPQEAGGCTITDRLR